MLSPCATRRTSPRASTALRARATCGCASRWSSTTIASGQLQVPRTVSCARYFPQSGAATEKPPNCPRKFLKWRSSRKASVVPSPGFAYASAARKRRRLGDGGQSASSVWVRTSGRKRASLSARMPTTGGSGQRPSWANAVIVPTSQSRIAAGWAGASAVSRCAAGANRPMRMVATRPALSGCSPDHSRNWSSRFCRFDMFASNAFKQRILLKLIA